MKRVHGVVLLFASLLVFGVILNGTVARDIAIIVLGTLAAVAVGLACTGGLCFLVQCAKPSAVNRRCSSTTSSRGLK